jgi:hypothetical protein
MELFFSQLSKGAFLKKNRMSLCPWPQDPQELIDYFALQILIICRMTFAFEYLGQFKFTFEDNHGWESWNLEGALNGKKKTEVDNLVQVYL